MSTTQTTFKRKLIQNGKIRTPLKRPPVTESTKSNIKRSLDQITPLRKSDNVVGPSPGVAVRKDTSAPFARPSRQHDEPPTKKPNTTTTTVEIKQSTSVSTRKSVKWAGDYRLGPVQGPSPVKCIQQYLARKDKTDDFYIVKILTLKDKNEKETTDDLQGRTLLHTEESLLDLLKNEEGVVQLHGLFRENISEDYVDANGETVTKIVKRLCLVLDCYVGHDYSPKYSNVTNMQYYVIKEKKLPEAEAIRIFLKVVQIVERLHKLNIVHRDLKLGNIIYNKDTKEVTLANFCLGKHLSSDNDLLKDQRGSPAYISPDVISGKPYLGKPSDMWALGVVLYTMLYGQFPFYDQSPTELFRKIKLGDFQIPVDVNVNQKTVELIKNLLVLDPSKRLTASEVVGEVRKIISSEQSLMSDSDLQVVPDCHPGMERPKKRSYTSERSGTLSDAAFADIAAILATKSPFETETCEFDDLEPFRKMAKRIVVSPKVPLPGVNSHITLDELQRIHAMYVARKLKDAASSGKICATLVPEDVAVQLTSSSSNGFNKSAITNLDCARVPDFSVRNNADAMKPASGMGLESRLALSDSDRAAQMPCIFHTQIPSFQF